MLLSKRGYKAHSLGLLSSLLFPRDLTSNSLSCIIPVRNMPRYPGIEESLTDSEGCETVNRVFDLLGLVRASNSFLCEKGQIERERDSIA